EQGFQVSSDIKKRVSFTVHNLLTSFAPLGLFDVIFCRNVLMYFSPELKSAILNRIAQAMRPNGYLLLGSSESPLGDSDVFKQKNSEYGIYFQRG
ncbi:MAG TPA: chemotaxis protein CheR, partial [Gammaproteobacteria bacterium]|nr:chemotaxis protein CheR [Gammaproteobacteria bacterium]